MNLLIKVRNELVHYKMGFTKPKYFAHLEERRIILVADNNDKEVDYPLSSKLNCSEGIRWAHNTACETVKKLAEFADEKFDHLADTVKSNFPIISENEAKEWFLQHGIDPSSDNPPKTSKR